MYLLVPLQKTRFPVDWILVVEECIANICQPLDIFVFCCYDDFLCFEMFLGFGVFANQPSVHNGGVGRGILWLWLLALVTGDR